MRDRDGSQCTLLPRRRLLDADWTRLYSLGGAKSPNRGAFSFFHPRFACVYLLRTAQGLHGSGYPRLAKLFSLANVCFFNFEASPAVVIGEGLVIPHAAGTVIGARSIGRNLTIFQQVTLGARTADFGFDPATRPQVGDDVTLSAGAKIIGPVFVGNGATVGANAVLLEDLPPNALAVGVPARVVVKGETSETPQHSQIA